MSIGAIIVGAGEGRRLQQSKPKCLIEIDGLPLILIAAWPFEQSGSIDEIILVVPAGYENELKELTSELGFAKVHKIVRGGSRRQDSVKNGVDALSESISEVMIHDGARALLSTDLLDRFVLSAPGHQAALAAIPVTSTLHSVERNMTSEGPDRSSLVAAQTPQYFRRDILSKALELAVESDLNASDEICLVRESLGINAAIIPGEPGNVKITHPGDLTFYLPQLRSAVNIIRENKS